MLSRLIFFGEKCLLLALKEYTIHYHQERNHQGKDNRLLFPSQDFDPDKKESEIASRSRLGGVLKYYYQRAA
jgi:putative transposase